MIEIRRGDELGESSRRRITEVLVRGFADDFAYFSKDPRELADAFAHMLVLERFYVAVVDGEPAAVASVTEGAQECFAPEKRPFRDTWGRVHGAINYRIVRSQFLGAYDGARDGLAEIGFVTTAPEHQGQGVGTALMRHLIAAVRRARAARHQGHQRPGARALPQARVHGDGAPSGAVRPAGGFLGVRHHEPRPGRRVVTGRSTAEAPVRRAA